jgi:hypothetical protein
MVVFSFPVGDDDAGVNEKNQRQTGPRPAQERVVSSEQPGYEERKCFIRGEDYEGDPSCLLF